MTGENFGIKIIGIQKLLSGNLDGGRQNKKSDKTIRHSRWGMPLERVDVNKDGPALIIEALDPQISKNILIFSHIKNLLFIVFLVVLMSPV